MNGSETRKPPAATSTAWEHPELEEWAPSGPTLDTSGKLHDTSPPPASALPSPSTGAGQLSRPQPALELDLRRPAAADAATMTSVDDAAAARAEGASFGTESREVASGRSTRRGGAVVNTLLGLMVATVLGAILWIWFHAKPAPMSRPSAPTVLLFVDSQPAGAEIRVGGRVLGKTPLVTDNVFPGKNVPVELHLRGYRVWTGQFEGEREQRIEATLQRLSRKSAQ